MTEVELKFRVDDLSAAERILAADTLGPFTANTGQARATQLEDRYVDTQDGALARAGFAVRLRQTGGETLVSVKSLSHIDGDDGSFHREELEGPADRVAPPAEWPASDARALILEHAGDGPLVERVTIRQLRRKRQLRSSTTRVELSLDEVDVVSRGRVVERFAELEAEITKGDGSDLAELGAAIATEGGLQRARTSKLEQALAALDGAPDDRDGLPIGAPDGAGVEPGAADGATRLTVGPSPGVVAEDVLAEAGRKVMRFHLARMLDREAGVRAGDDPAHVHKMRVATRRQRAAWRVFGEAYRRRRTKAYRNELRDIARRLGAVRDLDVQLEALDGYRHDLPESERQGLEALAASWRRHRADAHELLVRELDSPSYARFIDDYLDFVRTEGSAAAVVGATEPHRVRDTASSRIWAAYEQVRTYEPVLRWADVATLHELRIAGKWLRYSLEFVAEALGPDAKPLIARVTDLQDHLGAMNDANLAASMSRTFLVEHAASLTEEESAAIGRYLVDREREVMRLRRSIGSPWRAVVSPSFRRQLGRVVAGL